MNKKYQKLLQYLAKQNKPVTAQQIADDLSVSSRSVKTYISGINQEYDNIISSSRNGYQSDSKIINSMLAKDRRESMIDIPQNYEERSHYLVKRLMEDNDLQIENLSDEIYVSTQTLVNDIKKMNTQFNRYDVSFEITKGAVSLVGKESSKRKLISKIIRDEAKSSVFDINFLEEQFVDYDVEKMSSMIKDIFYKNGFYFNEFNYENLILHIMIIIVRNDYDDEDNEWEVNDNIRNLTEQIVKMVEENWNINISDNSRNQLQVLLSCHSINPDAQPETSKNEQERSIVQFVDKLLEQIMDNYGVDLSNDIFKYPFTLHIANLYRRLKNKVLVNNPLGDGIRKSCPTIYEIAVEVAFEIADKWHCEIDENEISFIALHIGGEIQRQQQDKGKQPVALVIQDYHGLREWLYNQMMVNFGSRIKIVGFYEQLEDVEDKEMAIITLDQKYDPKVYPNTIVVKAFASLPNMEIVNLLDKIDNEKKLKILYQNFNVLFKSSLFMVSNEIDYKEAIWRMTKLLLNEEYVGDEFYKRVLQREEASSTAFGAIAIPHSTKFDGLTTAICVLVDQNGIEWKDNKVNIVFLISVNKADSTYFRAIIGALIQLFENEELVEELSRSKNFQEFKAIIFKHKSV